MFSKLWRLPSHSRLFFFFKVKTLRRKVCDLHASHSYLKRNMEVTLRECLKVAGVVLLYESGTRRGFRISEWQV
jgi:hypothetical protein